jgi:hypothetical protein
MKYKLLALAASVFLLAGCLQSWKEYSSNEGKYSVLMPGTPTNQTRNMNTPTGSITLYASALENNDTGYVVTYNDIPESLSQVLTPELLLQSIRKSAVSNVQGKLVDDQPITLASKYPGREIQVEIQDGKRVFRNRMYIVGNRLYQVVFAGTKDEIFSKDANKFLDSFKILGS